MKRRSLNARSKNQPERTLGGWEIGIVRCVKGNVKGAGRTEPALLRGNA